MIDLGMTDAFGIIWLEENGEVYSNQTGGYSCSHPEARGVFQPLQSCLEESFEDHFAGASSVYGGWCMDGIEEKTADWLDSVFEWTKDFLDQTLAKCRVDREKMKKSMEAWVYIKMGDKKGVLTWNNSD